MDTPNDVALIAKQGISFFLDIDCMPDGRALGTIYVYPGIREERDLSKEGVENYPHYSIDPTVKKIAGPMDDQVARIVMDGLVKTFRSFGFNVDEDEWCS